MRYFSLKVLYIMLLLFAAIQPIPAEAHERDMYFADRAFEIRLGESSVDLRVSLYYKELPSLVDRMDMDADSDGLISRIEARRYADARFAEIIESLELRLGGRPLRLMPLGAPQLDLYGRARVVPAHHDFIVDLSSRYNLPEGEMEKGFELRFKDSLAWPYPGKITFALLAGRKIAVDSSSIGGFPGQVEGEKLRNLAFYCRRRTESQVEQAALKNGGEGLWRIVWYTRGLHRPRLAMSYLGRLGGNYAEMVYTGEKAVVETDIFDDGEDSFRRRVQDYFERGEEDTLGLWLLILAVFLYGCLHALAPGHAKTVTAAYLVGSRHSWPYAVLLAATVTLTHTGSILILAIFTRLAWGDSLGFQAQAMLTGLSGVIVMLIGIQRLKAGAGHTHPHSHNHNHGNERHEHYHHGDHSHHQEEGTEVEDRGERSLMQVIWLGLAGGLMPCPGAIWVYFLALGFGRPGLAVILILAMSLGLALVLVAVGLTTIGLRELLGRKGQGEGEGKKAVDKLKSGRFLEWAARGLPTLAGVALVVLGSFLLWKSLADLGIIG